MIFGRNHQFRVRPVQAEFGTSQALEKTALRAPATRASAIGICRMCSDVSSWTATQDRSD